MIRYRLDGNIRKHSTSYTIYIKEKSMPLLRTLVQPYGEAVVQCYIS
jgi:hypothetical protein